MGERKKIVKTVIKDQPKVKGGMSFSILHKTLPFLVIIISMQIASQLLAQDLGNNYKMLGKPLFLINGEAVYPFWAILKAYLVSLRWGTVAIGNIIYQDAKVIALGAFIAVFLYFLLVLLRRLNVKADTNLLTTNRWGTTKDLKDVGLLNKNGGVVLGQTLDAKVNGSIKNGSVSLNVKKPGKLIQYDMNVSSLLIAGSRLGKGVSTVVPTHLNFPGSIISIDPKGENYALTAGYRAKFSHVIKFNPVSEDTVRLNIMDEMSEEFLYRDANMIATILTSSDNAANQDPHWEESARVLLTGAILHCKTSSYQDKSLPGVYRFLTSASNSSNIDSSGKQKNVNDKRRELLNTMIRSVHNSDKVHLQIQNCAGQILTAADQEMGSIFSVALRSLSVFNDPLVANAVSHSDFCLEDFRESDIPISWYITIPFSDLDRLKTMVKLIIEFVCRKFSQGLIDNDKKALKNRILFLIDEFPTLGRMATIETFAGILNGYGISFLWIAQSKEQIDKLYGRETSLYEHCRFITIYAVGDEKAGEYFSKRIGRECILKQNSTSSGNRYDAMMNQLSVNSDVTERSLMTSNELASLSCEYEVILTQGGYPQLAKKVAYYSDVRFKDKVNIPPPKGREELLKQVGFSILHKKSDEDEFYSDGDLIVSSTNGKLIYEEKKKNEKKIIKKDELDEEDENQDYEEYGLEE